MGPKPIDVSVIVLLLFHIVLGERASAQIKYQDIKSIVDDHCVVCHSSDGPMNALPFESLVQIKGNQDRMFKAIENRVMPYGNPDFIDTDDGKKLILWLKTGSDLYDDPAPRSHLIDKDPRTLTFADLEPVIKSRCQICHAPGKAMAKIPLTSVANLKRRAKSAWKMLDEAEMPPNDSNFAFSVEGRALAGWLRYGSDVTWRDRRGDDDGVRR